MRCTAATYGDRAEATVAKRRVLRTFQVRASVTHCSGCDKYHLDSSRGKSPIPLRWHEILRCLALGYRDNEIGPLVGMTPRSVEFTIGQMCKRFYALSRPNLVAIAIAVGIVDPNEFVPAEEERHHA